MKRLPIPAALMTLTACSQTPVPEAPTVATVAKALCRPNPEVRPMTGCYLTLTASRVAGEGQIHETKAALRYPDSRMSRVVASPGSLGYRVLASGRPGQARRADGFESKLLGRAP